MQPTRTTARWLHAIGIAIGVLGAPLLSGSVAAADQGDAVLRVHQRYYPGSLDPQQSAGVEFAAFLGANYEGLTRLDQDLNVVPAAAESWEFSDDGVILTFSLREGLTYSDGSPLSAERFAEAVRRTCDPNVHGDYQHILFDVAGCQELATLYDVAEDGTPVSSDDLAAYEAARANVGVRALDDCTLEITLTHPAPCFPAIAGLPVFDPAKQELIEQGGEEWWRDPALQIGNGPFQVAHMEPEQSVTFEANDRYWGGRPRLDRLELVYIADSEEALEAYQAGDLDMVSIEAEQLGGDAQLDMELVRVPIAATSFLSFNLTQEPFMDKKVREAFAYAFDRGTYCEQRRDGGCEAALGWIPPGLPGHVASDEYAFDPDSARQALAESSYGGPEALPEISYAYWSEDTLIAEWTEWIAGQYREILGVEITLQPLKRGCPDALERSARLSTSACSSARRFSLASGVSSRSRRSRTAISTADSVLSPVGRESSSTKRMVSGASICKAMLHPCRCGESAAIRELMSLLPVTRGLQIEQVRVAAALQHQLLVGALLH